MKVQLLIVCLVLMCLAVHCKQVRSTSGKLRSNRSPVDGQSNEYGQPLEHKNRFQPDPQFLAQPGAGNDYGFNPDQEAPVYNVGNVPEGPLEQNIPIVTEQSVQDNVAVLPTQQNLQPESDEEDDDEDIVGIGKIDKNNGQSINFFPVIFGSGRGRSGGLPVGTVAVANSFSTGRKGVATSNANAFASPVDQYGN